MKELIQRLVNESESPEELLEIKQIVQARLRTVILKQDKVL